MRILSKPIKRVRTFKNSEDNLKKKKYFINPKNEKRKRKKKRDQKKKNEFSLFQNIPSNIRGIFC